tara:strand:- start:233 stop:439 length:207 start_codon:yes stop_codon:yes gene_type:complete
MLPNDDLVKRHANALHVQATNRLSGVRVSKYMAERIELYANGQLSLAELLAEAKIRHHGQRRSLPSRE